MAEAWAPGWPGIPPRWTSSAKDGIGTALGRESRVWVTLSHGILNEIYYPRIDQACTRDMGLVVTDGADFFSEEKRHAVSQTACPYEGVPAYEIVSTCRQGRYRIEKTLIADPGRDVVLQRTRFVALIGDAADYQLHVLLAPHLGNRGSGNTGWIGDYKGVPMLFAERDGRGLALACSAPWKNRSVGFVGVSDGWQDLSCHRRMTWNYTRAENGNIALTGEIDLAAIERDFVLALGFGGNAAEAGQFALASLLDGFESAHARYLEQWVGWQTALRSLKCQSLARDLYATSVTMLRAHEAKRFPGAIIASLSV